LPPDPSDGSEIRDLLVWGDEEMVAFLVRNYWHAILITPFVFQAFEGREWWEPSAITLPRIESSLRLLPQQGLIFADIPIQATRLRWRMDFDLANEVVRVDRGDGPHEVALKVANTAWSPAWPAAWGIAVAFEPGNDALPHHLTVRPMRSPLNWAVTRLRASEKAIREIRQAGLLAEWEAAVWDWERVAIAWLAVYRNNPPTPIPLTETIPLAIGSEPAYIGNIPAIL
jgi:hypothetical protein